MLLWVFDIVANAGDAVKAAGFCILFRKIDLMSMTIEFDSE